MSTELDRRALRAVAVQFFVNGAVVASYVPRLPEIRDEVGASLSTIGWVLAVATVGGVLGSALVGRATEELSTKRVMLVGSTFLVLLLPLVGVVDAVWQLLLVLGLIHAADVFTDVAMNVQGSALSTRRAKPVMNRLHATWSLGTVVGGLIATGMAAAGVDLGVHLALAALALLATLLYVAPGLLTHDDRPPPATANSSRRLGRVLWFFLLVGAAAVIPEMVNSDWAAFRATEDLAASEGVAALAYVAFTAGMVIGRLNGDTVVHRFGSQVAIRAATVIAALGIAIATLVPWIGSVFIGLFIAALGVSVVFPQLYDAAAKSPGGGRSLGALTAGSRVGLLIAPAMVGFLAEADAFTVGQAIAVVTIPAVLAVLVLTSALGTSGQDPP